MLSKTSYKIMKHLHKTPNTTQEMLQNKFSKDTQRKMDFILNIENLKSDKFIMCGNMRENGKDFSIYSLSPKGEGEYLTQRRSNLEFRLTQIIAVSALIISIISLFV